IVRALERPPARGAVGLPYTQILDDGEVGEDPAVFGNEADAEPADLVSAQATEWSAIEEDLPAREVDQTNDGLERRRLAGAVAAEQADDLTTTRGERPTVQHVAAAVARVNVAQLEHVTALSYVPSARLRRASGARRSGHQRSCVLPQIDR